MRVADLAKTMHTYAANTGITSRALLGFAALCDVLYLRLAQCTDCFAGHDMQPLAS